MQGIWAAQAGLHVRRKCIGTNLTIIRNANNYSFMLIYERLT